jgi:hypothetical protein
MFDNKVIPLKRIFGRDRDEATAGGREIHI